jgi:endonuclease/exonuclease/phosphatase family metal-dependent hydrolase
MRRLHEAADTTGRPITVGRLTPMETRVLTWNIFHGRDGPPDPALYTRWAEWTRKTMRNETHVQVNRDLWREFTDMVCGADWDVALLQECPPRWQPGFERECGAESFRSLTSRNWLERISWRIARGWPDLIGSSEGGSNLILARPQTGGIAEPREITIRRRRPERRTMAFARLGNGLCVTSIHASTSPPRAEEELLLAAEHAVEWAGDDPLVFGGDFNVRPGQSEVFEQLAERFGLTGITADDSIDHLLVRNLDVVSPPRAWAPEERELEEDGLALRLSDHAPVELTVRFPGAD